MQTTSLGDSVKETKVCETHGEYEADVWSFQGREFTSMCPLCEKEEEKREEIEQGIRKLALITHNRERKFNERGIPRRFQETKLSDYVTDSGDKHNVFKTVASYLENQEEVSKLGRSLLFYGNIGTGKTRLATSIVKGWNGVGYYTTAREYTRLIRSTYSSASKVTEQDVVDRFTDYSILVIDEIGKQFATDNERYAIFDIINARYNEMKPTILVSNMSLEDIEEFLGKATVDRIKENGGHAILFDWESFRSKK